MQDLQAISVIALRSELGIGRITLDARTNVLKPTMRPQQRHHDMPSRHRADVYQVAEDL